jgi:hypothetical protein
MRRDRPTRNSPNSTSSSDTSSPEARSNGPSRSRSNARDDDKVDLDRVSFVFAKRGYSDLVAMIRVLNTYVVELTQHTLRPSRSHGAPASAACRRPVG